MNTALSEVLREYRQLPWTNASCRLLMHNNYLFTDNSSKNLFSVSSYCNPLSPPPPHAFNLSFFNFYCVVYAKMDSLEYDDRICRDVDATFKSRRLALA